MAKHARATWKWSTTASIEDVTTRRCEEWKSQRDNVLCATTLRRSFQVEDFDKTYKLRPKQFALLYTQNPEAFENPKGFRVLGIKTCKILGV